MGGRPSRAVARRTARHAIARAGRGAGLQDSAPTQPACCRRQRRGMKAGLAALVAGEAEAASALPPPELRATLGYADYDTHAKRFIIGG